MLFIIQTYSTTFLISRTRSHSSGPSSHSRLDAINRDVHGLSYDGGSSSPLQKTINESNARRSKTRKFCRFNWCRHLFKERRYFTEFCAHGLFTSVKVKNFQKELLWNQFLHVTFSATRCYSPTNCQSCRIKYSPEGTWVSFAFVLLRGACCHQQQLPEFFFFRHDTRG